MRGKTSTKKTTPAKTTAKAGSTKTAVHAATSSAVPTGKANTTSKAGDTSATPVSPAPAPASGGLSGLTIGLIVAGVLLAVVAAVGVLYWLRKKKETEERDALAGDRAFDDSGPVAERGGELSYGGDEMSPMTSTDDLPARPDRPNTMELTSEHTPLLPLAAAAGAGAVVGAAVAGGGKKHGHLKAAKSDAVRSEAEIAATGGEPDQTTAKNVKPRKTTAGEVAGAAVAGAAVGAAVGGSADGTTPKKHHHHHHHHKKEGGGESDASKDKPAKDSKATATTKPEEGLTAGAPKERKKSRSPSRSKSPASKASSTDALAPPSTDAAPEVAAGTSTAKPRHRSRSKSPKSTRPAKPATPPADPAAGRPSSEGQ